MDFKMATGEFERMRQNLEEAKKFNMKVKEDFSLGADEVLVMKPMAKKKNKDEVKDGGGDPFDLGGPPGDLAPPKSKKKKKKKKVKKKASDDNKDSKKEEPKKDDNENLFDDNFGEFAEAENGGNNDDGSWATFD